jgi:ribulose-5-phosphate 4-epimerase/fuculose-1-phosphate aldolase
MYYNGLKELELISKAVGSKPDLIQGGGGNTSVKLDERLMAVKASGCKLSQVTPSEGFVVVDYKNIRNYFDNVDLNSGIDYEKDSVEFAQKNVVEIEGLKKLRPSVEAGFHSILKKYVIHTHAVYANILCCAQNGKELAEKIFAPGGYSFVWVEYVNPGFGLTLKIKDAVAEHTGAYGRHPEIIFMQNHGIVVNSDSCSRCIELHSEAMELIRECFGIKDEYPGITLEKAGDNTYISRTKYLEDALKGSSINEDYLDKTALYPDQLVYLNGSVSFGKAGNKLNINTETGELIYNASYSEALTIEETLLAYLYVIGMIEKCGLQIKTMSDTGKDFINNWESEKYRKSLISEKD